MNGIFRSAQKDFDNIYTKYHILVYIIENVVLFKAYLLNKMN